MLQFYCEQVFLASPYPQPGLDTIRIKLIEDMDLKTVGASSKVKTVVVAQ